MPLVSSGENEADGGGTEPAAESLFALDAEQGASPCGQRMSRAQLDQWAVLYGTQHRQLRRWIKRGREKGDDCPLADPVMMPAWWARNMTWTLPDKIASAAEKAKVERPLEPPASAQSATRANPPAAPPPADPIDLSSYDLGEGEAVRQQRRIVGALYAQLERAYLSGGNSDVLQGKYNRAVDALRKLEKDDREDQKARGLLVSRLAMQRDIDAATELLRQMRESMVRRILELCPTLEPNQRAEVSAAIVAVRENEDRVFQKLETLKTKEDVFHLLNTQSL